MESIISYEEIRLWRSSTEKITLEEFAHKLGKKLCNEKKSTDLYDVVKTQEAAPVEILPEISFKKELTDREKVVFSYLSQNKNRVVYVKELAKVLSLPNDYVYKYIKNIREKLENDILENAEKGGYILH
ncbi:MAG: helix-turn-helix domain-containing protein [Candidatus Gastranaerophilales bacterium]|nr:helix-turn-helix domain-containing protein [Candidatus Gastranaerophilales bacterium]